jgi:hypothetical protein
MKRGNAQTDNTTFAVENWLGGLKTPAPPQPLFSQPSPHLPFSRPPDRSPLRQIQHNQPTRISKGRKKALSMVDPKVREPVTRSQRTRRGYRSRNGADKGPVQQCQTAEADERDLENPFAETNAPLTLRSVASLPSGGMTSTSPPRSPTRTISSRRTGKAALSITKREHLANLTPAVKVYSDVRDAMAKTAMPKIVEELWKNTLFTALYEEAFIPVGLEVS